MAGKKFDIERYRDELIKVVKDNLNTKLADINQEKGDGVYLRNIPTTSYYNDAHDNNITDKAYIYYGFVPIIPDDKGVPNAVNVTMFISVVFDNTNKKNTETMVLRYTRALKEVIEDNYKKFPSTSRLSVIQFVPEDFENNKGAEFKIGGVQVSASII